MFKGRAVPIGPTLLHTRRRGSGEGRELFRVTQSQLVMEPRGEPGIPDECLMAIQGHSPPAGVGGTEPEIPDEC